MANASCNAAEVRAVRKTARSDSSMFRSNRRTFLQCDFESRCRYSTHSLGRLRRQQRGPSRRLTRQWCAPRAWASHGNWASPSQPATTPGRSIETPLPQGKPAGQLESVVALRYPTRRTPGEKGTTAQTLLPNDVACHYGEDGQDQQWLRMRVTQSSRVVPRYRGFFGRRHPARPPSLRGNARSLIFLPGGLGAVSGFRGFSSRRGIGQNDGRSW